jgi:soluble lytic murein transglycosylase-like protein
MATQFLSTVERWRFAAESVARRNRLPVELLLAVIQVESGGEPSAWNPEPHYRYLYNVRTKKPFRKLTPDEIKSERPPIDFPYLAGDRDQEWWAQQASWGLMQVMGAVARERGCKLPFLPGLIEPCIGIEYGALHLLWLANRYLNDHGWAGVLRGYNGGPYAVFNQGINPDYPKKVLSLWTDINAD